MDSTLTEISTVKFWVVSLTLGVLLKIVSNLLKTFVSGRILDRGETFISVLIIIQFYPPTGWNGIINVFACLLIAHYTSELISSHSDDRASPCFTLKGSIKFFLIRSMGSILPVSLILYCLYIGMPYVQYYSKEMSEIAQFLITASYAAGIPLGVIGVLTSPLNNLLANIAVIVCRGDVNLTE